MNKRKLIHKTSKRIRKLGKCSKDDRDWYLDLLGKKELARLDELLNMDITAYQRKHEKPISELLDNWKQLLQDNIDSDSDTIADDSEEELCQIINKKYARFESLQKKTLRTVYDLGQQLQTLYEQLDATVSWKRYVSTKFPRYNYITLNRHRRMFLFIREYPNFVNLPISINLFYSKMAKIHQYLLETPNEAVFWSGVVPDSQSYCPEAQ